MSCNLPPEILTYIELVEADTPRACPEQHALVALIRRVFETEDIHVDTDQLRKYMGLVKYFPYGKLLPWEEFLEALWNCTYTADGLPRWDTVLCMVGRGAGKDGLIAFDGMCSVSPYNPVSHYNVDICAHNEEQATTPVKDIAEALENPKFETKLKKHFYHTKEAVQGRKNKGVIKGRTNNPKGRDGMRSGKIIFNEVHAYENYDNIPERDISPPTGMCQTARWMIYWIAAAGSCSTVSRIMAFCHSSAACPAGNTSTIKKTGTWRIHRFTISPICFGKSNRNTWNGWNLRNKTRIF